MAAHISVRYATTVSSGGVAKDFAQPFVAPQLSLDQQPAAYDVPVAVEVSVTLWDGSPLPATFSFLQLQSTSSVDVEFTVDGGNAGELQFTLFLRGGGFPITIPGQRSFTRVNAGVDSFVTGTADTITKIRAHNFSTTDAAVVSVLIG